MDIKIKKDNKISSETLKSYLIDFFNFDGRCENDKEEIVKDLNFIESYYGVKFEEIEIVDNFEEGWVRATVTYDNGDVNYYEIF